MVKRLVSLMVGATFGKCHNTRSKLTTLFYYNFSLADHLPKNE